MWWCGGGGGGGGSSMGFSSVARGEGTANNLGNLRIRLYLLPLFFLCFFLSIAKYWGLSGVIRSWDCCMIYLILQLPTLLELHLPPPPTSILPGSHPLFMHPTKIKQPMRDDRWNAEGKISISNPRNFCQLRVMYFSFLYVYDCLVPSHSRSLFGGYLSSLLRKAGTN